MDAIVNHSSDHDAKSCQVCTLCTDGERLSHPTKPQHSAAMKPNQVGLEEGRRTLPELTAQAHAGLCSILTRHGRPYAALVPVSMLPQPPQHAGFLALRGSCKGLWTNDAAAEVAALRDEWS